MLDLMKRWHWHTVILVLLAAAISAALLLWSGRAHARVGLRLHIDVPLWAPWYYAPPPPYYYPYYPPYYYPPAAPPPPTAYVEQPPPPPVWYYCAESKTYYPYVRDCPGGWQRVPATPPAR
jgi:hypothetical protein